MTDRTLKHLYDIHEAAEAIHRFVHDKTLGDYRSDPMLSSAVERKFEIVGEALNRIGREDPATLDQIREYRDIISFRNLLAHGYDNIDDRIVWGIIEEDLDLLLTDVRQLIDEMRSTSD